eukprot:Hpha_TRINITY_DN8157_c0_g1::TRINITY_DN8157_c0_g1_i1::g.172127::m.172127
MGKRIARRRRRGCAARQTDPGCSSSDQCPPSVIDAPPLPPIIDAPPLPPIEPGERRRPVSADAQPQPDKDRERDPRCSHRGHRRAPSGRLDDWILPSRSQSARGAQAQYIIAGENAGWDRDHVAEAYKNVRSTSTGGRREQWTTGERRRLCLAIDAQGGSVTEGINTFRQSTGRDVPRATAYKIYASYKSARGCDFRSSSSPGLSSSPAVSPAAGSSSSPSPRVPLASSPQPRRAGRPALLTEAEYAKCAEMLSKLRQTGGVVSSRVFLGVASAVVRSTRGAASARRLSLPWAAKYIRARGWVRRSETTGHIGGVSSPRGFIRKLRKMVRKYAVPRELVFNVDETAARLVTAPRTTLELKGTTKVAIAGRSDKRAVTAVLALSPDSILPPQLIYSGRSGR